MNTQQIIDNTTRVVKQVIGNVPVEPTEWIDDVISTMEAFDAKEVDIKLDVLNKSITVKGTKTFSHKDCVHKLLSRHVLECLTFADQITVDSSDHRLIVKPDVTYFAELGENTTPANTVVLTIHNVDFNKLHICDFENRVKVISTYLSETPVTYNDRKIETRDIFTPYNASAAYAKIADTKLFGWVSLTDNYLGRVYILYNGRIDAVIETQYIDGVVKIPDFTFSGDAGYRVDQNTASAIASRVIGRAKTFANECAIIANPERLPKGVPWHMNVTLINELLNYKSLLISTESDIIRQIVDLKIDFEDGYHLLTSRQMSELLASDVILCCDYEDLVTYYDTLTLLRGCNMALIVSDGSHVVDACIRNLELNGKVIPLKDMEGYIRNVSKHRDLLIECGSVFEKSVKCVNALLSNLAEVMGVHNGIKISEVFRTIEVNIPDLNFKKVYELNDTTVVKSEGALYVSERTVSEIHSVCINQDGTMTMDAYIYLMSIANDLAVSYAQLESITVAKAYETIINAISTL